MIINDDVEGLKRKIEQLKTELKCVEGMNKQKFEENVKLNIENVRLKNRVNALRIKLGMTITKGIS